MDTLFFIAIAIGVILFSVFPLLLILLIYLLLKKWSKKVANAVTVLLLLCFAIMVYQNFYPSDNYYINNFKEYTQIPFPDSGKITDKVSSASAFDFGGKTLCALVKLSKDDYSKLYQNLQKPEFTEKKYYNETDEVEVLLSKAGNPEISKILVSEKSGMSYSVLFLSNRNSVIMYYANR